MSRLKELIAELCPQGVEWKKLGDIVDILRGRRLTKKELTDNAEYPVYHGGIEPIGYYTQNNRPANTVMIINVGASAGTVGFCDKPFWSSDGCYCIGKSTLISDKYLFYLLSKNQLAFVSKVRHAGIPTLDSKVIANFEIPVPPLPVQEEIVRILDKFTTLEAALEAELDCRKRQYEFYRNQLLSFDKVGGANSEVKWMKLGDVCQILDSMRKPITKDKRNAGMYPYYGASGIVDYVEDYIFDGDFLLVSEDGANLEMRTTPIAFSISGKNWVNNHAHILKFDDITTQKFVEHYIEQMDISMCLSKGSMPKLTQGQLKSIELPLPPLSEQQRIVSILDRFEALTTDLQSGLPAEIEARRKQYEYYREQLLTFKRKTA